MKNKTVHPPKWATRFLRAYCRPELLEDLQGDLHEFFDRNLQARGAFVARLIYVIDVLKFFRSYTVRKPAVTNPLNTKFMIGSYIKTSGRSIMRSKLFSGINIVGLAVSMSVGLLVLAVVSDLLSYDSTLNNRDRMFRVISTLEWPDQPPMKLASTSWKGGNLIHDEIPGVESITILRNNFGGDAKIGESTIPVSGLYADEGFFDVFSFPLLKGVAATALKQPHTLVLTETTAEKLFGQADPMGRVIPLDSVNYTVTGVMKDIPKLSHIHFEMLASLSSIDVNSAATPGDGDNMDWFNCFSNYVYVTLAKNTSPAAFTAALSKVNQRENVPGKNKKVSLSLQPLKDIAVGKQLG
ncbi:ABC transporter permease, partial [Puia sp.]|uniref:ABC transporter permease n=1 Tax=Puia sp. TaxID=2045100 RepID=UPI002F3ECF33